MIDEKKNDGGPAFPTENEHQTGNHTMHFQGMSLRDYFAAKAMSAIIAMDTTKYEENSVSKSAYKMADAMLEERTK